MVNLEKEVKKAKDGNKDALAIIIEQVKDMIYNLSLKMLLFPEDAKDATQEILIRIITHLGTFKHESKFTTWAYRIATNYLLTVKSKKSKELTTSFEEYADLIDSGQSAATNYSKNEGLLQLLEEEVKISCTHGLLLCLNKKSRIIYILGDILNINSIEGAQMLDISPANFRKQLSRSRVKIRNFLQSKCGLANRNNPCRCTKKINFLIDTGKINPDELQFSIHSKRSIDLVNKIDSLGETVMLYRSVPDFPSPPEMISEIQKTINAVDL